MKLEIINYAQEGQRIKFRIPFHAKQWRTEIKKVSAFYYHKPIKTWSIPNTLENMQLLNLLGGESVVFVTKKRQAKEKKSNRFVLNEEAKINLNKVEEKILLKGYSPSTKKSYLNALATFFKYFEAQNYDTITKSEIEGFIAKLIIKDRISESYQNVFINAIKFYYEQVLGNPKEYYQLQRPKRCKTLPNVLSLEEVQRLLKTPKNIKHKAILTLIYSAGLRIGEVIKVRIQDIRSSDKYIFISSAKGKKDRRVLLSPHLLKGTSINL